MQGIPEVGSKDTTFFVVKHNSNLRNIQMKKNAARPSTHTGEHDTYPWSYFDHADISLYLNPGLSSRQLLHITSAGFQPLPRMPKAIKLRLDPPLNAAPFSFGHAYRSGSPITIHDLQRDVFSWMTPAHYDCKMVMAWIITAPLAPWLADSIQLRFWGSSTDGRQHILETLSCLLYGHADAIGMSNTNPIVLADKRPKLETLNTTAKHGLLLATAGGDKTFTGELNKRTAYVQCNPNFDTSLIPLSTMQIDRWREAILAAQVQVISKLLKEFEDERATSPTDQTPYPYYKFFHGPVLHAISDIIDTI